MAATIATDTAVRTNSRPGRDRAIAGGTVPRSGPILGTASRSGDGTLADGDPAVAVIGSGRRLRAAATAGWPPPARYAVPRAAGPALVRPARGSGGACPGGGGGGHAPS